MPSSDHGADNGFRQDGLTIGHIEGLLQKGLTTGHIAGALGNLPAPAQGILGLQIREDDPEVLETIIKLNSEEAASQVAMERGLLAKFDSGCSLPLGVCSEITRTGYRMQAVLGRPSGDGWGKPAKADISGDDLAQIVEESYTALQEQ